MSEIDFGSVRSAATASLEGVQAPVADSSPTPAPEQVATEIADPAAPTPEAKKWKLKDPEGEFEADEDELKNGHLRFRDYTRKTTAVANERKDLAQRSSALSEREQKINALLSDANNVAQYYEFLTGQKLTPAQEKRVEQGLTPTPSATGGEVATLEEARALATEQANGVKAQIEQEMLANLAKTQQWTQNQIMASQAQAEMQRNAATYKGDLDTHIAALGKDMPLLLEMYSQGELETLLCQDVMGAEPKTIAEAKDMLVQAAKERNGRLEKAVTHRHKLALAGRAQMTTNGIEPVGGATAPPSATKHKLGDKALTQSAIAFMESQRK